MKKTILFYINILCKGGAERVIIQLAKHFAESGYRSVLVTSYVGDNEYPVPECVERISIEQEQVERGRLAKNIFRIRALRKIIKERKPEAVISFMAEPNFRNVIATIGLKVKSIVSVRNDPNREYAGKLGKIVGKFILPMADGCVFQTDEAKAWFPKKLQKKSDVILNDVDKVFFETEYKGGNAVVTLGRLSEQKNQKMLINAFAVVADKYHDACLNIYGIGPLKDELQKQIEKINMTDRIVLKGLTHTAHKVFAEAGIFVLPSDYEGMPNALLEALAIGVPSISTDCPCGGPRKLITDGVNGLLIPVNDEKALVQALDRLLQDRNYALNLGRKAKEMSSAYSTVQVFSKWKSFVENIINR